ncbi:MAG: hypothetical protein QF436_02210 [Candidatus Woesearchaeota archaeon]|jgi:predicted transcriptional regulator|nr:hypothetical protein [archaeon]MDP6547490.1 hypothetical protein [Candidatus Woesearchaeota archaeon]MDP7263907.1 hypothetical protein [Candidatus Woesearchaeota archaeon]MDP7622905.1 hypothetical protein [Candidatus Woesearchaeota archaeon]HJN57368.1 hypothetical protein [Candidatus Woesearchaeota archaeon]|tara:strand:- start:407 stop:619 length:213 start_codon:yes stop_codon:yes gene_type:complete
MGQEQVYTFLKKYRNKWFTSRQITDKLNASYGSVGTSLQKLRQSNIIKYKINKASPSKAGRRGLFVYQYK